MVSVIVAFYERLGHLKCCLDALALCSQDFDEVVVADDGSKDETVNRLKEMIAGYNFPITHVTHPKDGFRLSATRNNGIRHARGDYLLFLDCDFMVLPGTIKYHLKLAKPGRFVAGAYKYLTEEQSSMLLNSTIAPDLLERFYCELPEREIIVQHRRYMRRSLLMRLHLASPRKQSLGGFFSVYKKDIELINGYDENFVGWGGEDEDLGVRLAAAGIYCISAIRDARALHVWHPSELKTGKESGWKRGTFNDYFTREKIQFVCKNGLRKLGQT
jgi:glycosyltransferase involved in cell wall biosynthesis